MELGHTRLLGYRTDIVLIDASTWHNDDAVACLCTELAEQGDALLCSGLLS